MQQIKRVNTRDYVFSDAECNILKMVRDTIIEAFDRHPNESVEFIGVQLGISAKSVYRYLDQFNLRHLLNKK